MPASPSPRPTATAIASWSATAFLLSWAVFAASVWAIRQPPAWYTFEFCQYAEIGRNLAERGRFETRVVEPMALAYIDRHQVARPGRPEQLWPVINRYPLPALVAAALFRAFGPSDLAAAASNGLAASLLAATVVGLARAWFGRRGAALALLLWLANPSNSGAFLLLGTPDIWFALALALAILAWLRVLDAPGPRPELRRGLLAGLLAGLAYLCRFNMAPIVGLQVLVLLLHRRWRGALALAAVALLTVSPFLLETHRQFGRPTVGIYSAWNLLDGIGAFRIEPWQYYQVPNLAQTLSAHAEGLAHKVAENLIEIIPTRIWTLANLPVLLPLSLVATALGLWRSLLPRVAGPPVLPSEPAPAPPQPRSLLSRYLAWSAALFLLQLVLFSAMRLELTDRLSPHHGRYFYWFAAPATLGGLGLLLELARRGGFTRLAAAALVVLQIAVFAGTWASWYRNYHGESNLGRDPIRDMLREVVPPGRVVATNQPQLLGWFCDLRAVSMPADPDELDRLNARSPLPADFVFLDLNFNPIMLDDRWAALTRGPGSPWEARLLRDYAFVLPPDMTRPLMYVLLRRRGLPASALERRMGFQ